MHPSKSHPNPTPYAGVTLDSDSKSTYIPLNQPNFRFRSYSQGSITTHLPCTPPNLNEIQWPSLKLLTDSNSKSTYIPLSCRQNAIPLRLSSFSQGSICIYSPHTPPNFIQIQRHSSELHSISDSKSTYIPLSCHQNAIPSD